MRRAIRWSLLLVLWVALVWEALPMVVVAVGGRDCLQGWECYHPEGWNPNVQ